LAPARAQTWVQRNPATSPSARNGCALAFDAARGRAVLFGGYDSTTPDLGDTWVPNRSLLRCARGLC